MLRIDRSVTPTMAKSPTLGTWELDLLRSIENVVRLGHIRSVARRPARPRGGLGLGRRRRAGRELRRRRSEEPAARPDLAALRDHAPARPRRLPLLRRRLTGYVEATRTDDDAKNALCRPSPYGNSLTDWARMNVLGLQNTAAVQRRARHQGLGQPGRAQPRAGPARAPGSAELDDVLERVRPHVPPGLARLAELMV